MKSYLGVREGSAANGSSDVESFRLEKAQRYEAGEGVVEFFGRKRKGRKVRSDYDWQRESDEGF